MNLIWRDYTHFPYERELAKREAVSLLNGAVAGDANQSQIRLNPGELDASAVRRLTYFAGAQRGENKIDTDQSRLELSAGVHRRRQATRYSVHGLHEYKGKFNPQVCRALLNIFRIEPGDLIFDPFCGSGTTLVEAAHMGVMSIGTDVNPLAVFVANAKLSALSISAHQLSGTLDRIVSHKSRRPRPDSNARIRYLKQWFEPHQLHAIERSRRAIEAAPEKERPFFLTIASNLLREYSLQDPSDLRIRRRKTAGELEPFDVAFTKVALSELAKLEAAQEVVGLCQPLGTAMLLDNRALKRSPTNRLADAAVTSPPYATALPYIDTQRLSLVWLRLVEPTEIRTLEAHLTGSREMDGESRKKMRERMVQNAAGLPDKQARFCRRLEKAMGSSDGFRRRAVPSLLYRYFEGMRDALEGTRKALKRGAPFALIVGHNHTVLGGNRFDINTPKHLAQLAESIGWAVDEVTPLQTYRRYGLHAANAVDAETLVVLRNRPSPRRRNAAP